MATPDQIEQLHGTLEEHERELRLAVQELTTAARSWADPREPIRDRPFTWLASGLVLGCVLGWRS